MLYSGVHSGTIKAQGEERGASVVPCMDLESAHSILQGH